MADYPKWHDVADHVPLALVQHEIDAIRARLDAAGIPQVQVCDNLTPCDGSGSERWPNNGWTEAGDGTGYPGDLPTQEQADAAVAKGEADRAQRAREAAEAIENQAQFGAE